MYCTYEKDTAYHNCILNILHSFIIYSKFMQESQFFMSFSCEMGWKHCKWIKKLKPLKNNFNFKKNLVL